MKSNIEFREGLDELAGHYRHVLQLLGENPDREGLEKTPMRVAKAMQVLTRGYTQDPQKGAHRCTVCRRIQPNGDCKRY